MLPGPFTVGSCGSLPSQLRILAPVAEPAVHGCVRLLPAPSRSGSGWRRCAAIRVGDRAESSQRTYHLGGMGAKSNGCWTRTAGARWTRFGAVRPCSRGCSGAGGASRPVKAPYNRRVQEKALPAYALHRPARGSAVCAACGCRPNGWMPWWSKRSWRPCRPRPPMRSGRCFGRCKMNSSSIQRAREAHLKNAEAEVTNARQRLIAVDPKHDLVAGGSGRAPAGGDSSGVTRFDGSARRPQRSKARRSMKPSSRRSSRRGAEMSGSGTRRRRTNEGPQADSPDRALPAS